MSDPVTLATLRAQVRAQGAVRLNTGAIDAMLNAGITRLYRKISIASPDYLTLPTPLEIILTAGTKTAPMTSADPAVWIVRGVDIDIGGDQWLPIERFQWSRRGMSRYDAFGRLLPADLRVGSTQYHIIGSTIMFSPEPQGGLTARVWYIPPPVRLVNDADEWDAVAGWEEFPVLYALVKFAAGDEAEVAPWAQQLGALERDIMAEIGRRDSTQPIRTRDVDKERGLRVVRM